MRIKSKPTIELRGQKVSLRALEREDCRQLWRADEPAEPLSTEPLYPGLLLRIEFEIK